MAEISESEVQKIVQRVLNQLSGQSTLPEAGQSRAQAAAAAPSDLVPAPKARVVAVGADHGGYELKEILKKDLATWGYEVMDVGAHSKEAVDYPDFAHEVARLVASGKAWRGIMIDGAGIGSSMVANKVPGVRAAMAYDHASAVNSREHNDANLLTLGAGLIGVNLAKQIVKTWLSTEFGGGRHARRVDKITAVEKQYAK